MKGCLQKTVPRKTPRTLIKQRDGDVGLMVASHCEGGESLVVVTTLDESYAKQNIESV